MKNFLFLLIALLSFQIAVSQENTNALMSIDGREISSDEFLRIYNKNKNIAEDLQKSVDEYVDLFINYKLKVIEAENLGYDTMSAFVEEISKYTIQLTDAYFSDEETLDSLAFLEYQRSLIELNADHILIRLGSFFLTEDTIKAYSEALRIRKRLLDGEPFQKIVDEESVDPENKIGGNLGWFSAFRMVYPFEDAAYNTPVGEISMPVRTHFGYHLILVNGSRKNRGDVEASHIMTGLSQNMSDLEQEAARQKIENAYSELVQGVSWEEVVTNYSEHKASAVKNGYLGWLNAANSPEIILDSCFSVDSGAFSQPFLSPYGYHIIKPLNYKPIPAFEAVKKDYKEKLRKNPYAEQITKNQVLNTIKNDYGYEYFDGNADTIYSLIDSAIYENKWNPDAAKNLTEPIFTIGEKSFTQYDFAKFISEQKQIGKSVSLDLWFQERISIFINENLMTYERNKLSEKYPELRYLLEEYHDGILLFNLTEDEVWQKAVEDTSGLEKFYNELPEKYTWKNRIALTKYSYTDSLLIDPLLKLAKKKAKNNLTSEQISMQLCNETNKKCIKVEELKYEKGDNAIADSLQWKKGSYLTSKDKNGYVLYYADDILPAQAKTLKDARGLYTADYQSYLEKEWINKLRNKYSIDINEQVLQEIRSKSE